MTSLAELVYPSLLVGALIGVTFNRPSWLRSHATCLRFSLATLIYVGIYLAALLLAFLLLRDAGHLSAGLAGRYAFGCVVVMRFAPRVDEEIRRWIYRLSDMPGEARARAA